MAFKMVEIKAVVLPTPAYTERYIHNGDLFMYEDGSLWQAIADVPNEHFAVEVRCLWPVEHTDRISRTAPGAQRIKIVSVT